MSNQEIMQLNVNRKEAVERAFEEFELVTGEYLLNCTTLILLYIITVIR